MSCSYVLGDVDLPLDRIFEVRSWLRERNLLDCTFQVIESDDHALLTQADSYMSNSDAGDVDSLLEQIAGWISGTPLDGQVVTYECEGSAGVMVLVAGKLETVETDSLILACDAAPPPGEAANVTVTVRAIGLPGNRVVVIGTPADSD